MTCKTDWTAADYFNVEDYNRIVSNLNQAYALMHPLASAVTPIPAASVGQYLTIAQRNAIRDRFNGLMVYAGTGVHLLTPGRCWYNWQALNTIETWLQYVLARHLEDRNGAYIVDILGQDISMPDKMYRSVYSGPEINAFIAQIKEWNNGEL